MDRGSHYAVLPILPEVSNGDAIAAALTGEFSSADNVMDRAALAELLRI